MSADAMRTLYGRNSAEVRADLDAGIERAVAQLAVLRTNGDGAIERVDRLAEQLDGCRLAALRLRSALLRETREPRGAA